MKFWRSLTMPLHATSLVFIGLIAGAMALAFSATPAGVLRLLPALLLVSLLFKYAYALLEQAADGCFDAPVPTVEMLGPFEFRPLLQLVACLIVYQLCVLVERPFAQVILVASLALLPASIGALGVTRSLRDAVNPLALCRITIRLGTYYLLIVGITSVYLAMLGWLLRHAAWSFEIFAAGGLLLLSVYAGIGGAIYERRLQLGYEPRTSPERQAAKQRREHEQQLSRMLDRLYYPLRIGEIENALILLRGWLAEIHLDQIDADVDAIMEHALAWNTIAHYWPLRVASYRQQLRVAGSISRSLQ